jgi:hypothetical protein
MQNFQDIKQNAPRCDPSTFYTAFKEKTNEEKQIFIFISPVNYWI